MAAQKATDLRRALADVEAHVRELREREAELEHRMMTCLPPRGPRPLSRRDICSTSMPRACLLRTRGTARWWRRCSTISSGSPGKGKAIPAARNDELKERLCQEAIMQRSKS
jgi:hypothetical protein